MYNYNLDNCIGNFAIVYMYISNAHYVYICKGDVTEYEGEKPIIVIMKLENEMPVGLYTEFTKKV